VGAEVTRASFETQMQRMSGLKFPPETLDTHWEALHDMPDVLLAAAVAVAIREEGEFPAPKMLRAHADRIRSRVLPVGPEPNRAIEAEPRAVTLPTGKVLSFQREWEYYCDYCSDLGWESFACGEAALARQPWLETRACGREEEHGSHDWSAPCACAATNPAVLRRREKTIQMAAQRSKARGES
jgi:hypothetical protein